MAAMNSEWLRSYLSDASRKKLCTRIFCTTCGAMEFRRGLLGGLDHGGSHRGKSRISRDGVLEIAEALGGLGCPPDQEYQQWFDAVRCILFDLWTGIPILDKETENRLGSSWAGLVLEKMKEHYQQRLAARELDSPDNVERRREEKKRQRHEQHLERQSLKKERDRLWRLGKLQ